MIRPREVQQEWKRSSVAELRKQIKEHYGKDVLEEVCLLELEWCIEEVVVSYLTCERYRSQGCRMKENKGQRVISRRRLKELK